MRQVAMASVTTVMAARRTTAAQPLGVPSRSSRQPPASSARPAYTCWASHMGEIWADPWLSRPGEINKHYGGRGFYFRDPDGHLLELLTAPYGAEPERD